MQRLFVMALLTLVLAIGITACGTLTQDGLLFKTADERLNIGFRLLPAPDAPPLPPIAPAIVPPTATAVPILPTITPTPCRTIAGNINSQGNKLWHDESSPQWSQIVIDESKGEMWFCDIASAEAAGWTKAGGN